MENITIGRYENDPQAQGVVRAESGRWQVVIDRDGYPHLYLQVQIAAEDGEPSSTGMMCVDDLLPFTVRDLMDGGEWGGKLTPEEEGEAIAEYNRACNEGRRPPCPR